MSRSWSTTAAAASDPGIAASFNHARHVANGTTTWVVNHWASWLNSTVHIVLIVAAALLLRSAVRRMITRLIARMNRLPEARVPAALGGLLANAERRRQRSEAIGSVLRSVASFVILATATLTVLPVLDINIAPLLASAGVAGVAVGFGARNLVTDFLSGVFMILEDQYGVGDVIDAGVASGTVIEVGLRVTKLRGDNGETWYVRNGEVQRIGNLSQGWAVTVVDIQVGAGQDLDRVSELIGRAAEGLAKQEPWDEVLWEPVQVLGLSSVGPDSVVIQAQAKTMPGKAAGVARELRWRIKKTFDENGVTMVGGAVTATVDDALADAAGETEEPAPPAPTAPARPATEQPPGPRHPGSGS